MDGVLEELVDEGGQGGCRVLGDDRPSEDKFKILLHSNFNSMPFSFEFNSAKSAKDFCTSIPYNSTFFIR